MSVVPSPSRPREAAAEDAASWTGHTPDDNNLNLDIISWCPSSVDQIRQQFSSSTAEFLFSLPRKPAPLRDHSSCSVRSCIANSTSNDNYLSSHWGECQGDCDFQGPTIEKVVDTIQTGGIPLISLRQTRNRSIEIRVVRAAVGNQYFAVSHVWSGGLGNPMANKLPRCQLLHLYDLGLAFKRNAEENKFAEISRAWQRHRQPEVLIWMDTLCIPVGNGGVRSRAINAMAQIYGTAQAIIMLDHELQQIQFNANCVALNLGYMICSAWMTRCWTFQEGALAAEWLVESKNGLYSVDTLSSNSCHGEICDSKTAHLKNVTDELKDFYYQLPRYTDSWGNKTFDRNLWLPTWSASGEVTFDKNLWPRIGTFSTKYGTIYASAILPNAKM